MAVSPEFRNPAVSRHTRASSLLFLLGLFLGGTSLAQTHLSTGLSATNPKGDQVADRIVAVVNNEVITRNELNERTHEVEKALTQQGTALPARDILERQVLERMITDRAILQQAKENGIRVDDFTVDRAIVRVAEQNKMSLENLRQRVEQDGSSWAKFREDMRDNIEMERFRDREVDSTVQVSEGEIDNALAEQSAGQAATQEIDLAQILVRLPDQPTAEQIERARAKATDLYDQLKKGADFGKLAVSYSNAADALQGGDLGWRTVDRLPQLFVDAIAGLSPGEVAPPVRSPNGFHVLKLVGRRQGNGGTAGPAAAPVQQTHARHILIRVNDTTSSEQARTRLEDIRQRILANQATFEDMARSYSSDGSAPKGGDLGTIYPGDTVPEFERAMDALQPGEISVPVQTQFGWHLIQVLDRKVQDVSKDRQRMIVRNAIRERKDEEAFQDWVRSIRDRAYVEIRLDDR